MKQAADTNGVHTEAARDHCRVYFNHTDLILLALQKTPTKRNGFPTAMLPNPGFSYDINTRFWRYG